MKKTLIASSILIAMSLASPATFATDASTIVKDSVITTKIKTKLAAEKASTLATIHVDTDAEGVVYLTGTAKSEADIAKATEIAKGTEGVKSVTNKVVVKAEDK